MPAGGEVFAAPVPQRGARQRRVDLPGAPIIHMGSRPASDPTALLDRLGNRIIWVDPDLHPVAEMRLPAWSGRSHHDDDVWRVSGDGEWVVLLTVGELRIATGGVWVHRVPLEPRVDPWMSRSDLLILGTEAVIVGGPGFERWPPTGDVRPTVDHLIAVDLVTGEEGARRPGLDGYVIPQPAGEGFAVGEGNDSWARFSSIERTPAGFEVRTLDESEDRVLADIALDGQEILTVPHDGGSLCLFDWTTLAPISSLAEDDVFSRRAGSGQDDEDGFDYGAWFLDGGRILARTNQGRLLVIDRPAMEVVHEVVLDGFAMLARDGTGSPITRGSGTVAGHESELVDVTVTGPDRFLAWHADRHVELCTLPA